ncbi:PIR Superfamily Protein [Plasmodium ovale curtisi]|uniref:PIR Superfamily Protein n=1 Tax=Plasmodium ovale curtisi TaxID=864141 RepID=A0A1A8XCR7_PLAOA|nr:PIR Superfamily Protein [Plasmodium ovale curtisi]SBT03007.1 PIR Superfamily Protein [Plasmodium ovale curtisi]
MIKLENIISIKLLFDYLANYDVTENKRNICEIICTIKHKLLLSDIITNYNQLQICNNVFPEFCNEFDECKRTCGVEKLSTYHCNEDQVLSFSVRSSSVARLNLGKHKALSHSKSLGDAILDSSSIFPSDDLTTYTENPIWNLDEQLSSNDNKCYT